MFQLRGRNFERAGNDTPVGQGSAEHGGWPGIAVETREEAALVVEGQGSIADRR